MGKGSERVVEVCRQLSKRPGEGQEQHHTRLVFSSQANPERVQRLFEEALCGVRMYYAPMSLLTLRCALVLPTVLLTLLALGCATHSPREVSSPSPDEPHAKVSVSSIFEVAEGPHLSRDVAIDDVVVISGGNETHHAIPIHPGWATWRVSATFSHGVPAEPSRTFDHKWESRVGGQLPSLQTRAVVDGKCNDVVSHNFVAGRRYELTFRYRRSGDCELSCIEFGDGPERQCGATAVAPPSSNPSPS